LEPLKHPTCFCIVYLFTCLFDFDSNHFFGWLMKHQFSGCMKPFYINQLTSKIVTAVATCTNGSLLLSTSLKIEIPLKLLLSNQRIFLYETSAFKNRSPTEASQPQASNISPPTQPL
jgi:hypothetical protein